jgi:hypothetical protein
MAKGAEAMPDLRRSFERARQKVVRLSTIDELSRVNGLHWLGKRQFSELRKSARFVRAAPLENQGGSGMIGFYPVSFAERRYPDVLAQVAKKHNFGSVEWLKRAWRENSLRDEVLIEIHDRISQKVADRMCP